MMISAKVIADSILKPDYDNNPVSRITTMIVTFPRFILAEFNTHRMFSRNSASSRAIPFEKMLEVVQNNPFIPIAWQKHHKGMQGTEYFGGETCAEAWSLIDRAWGYSEYENKLAVDQLQKEWLNARDNAVQQAKYLSELEVTKQLCNRLLEPFMWHTVLVTATEWENFFYLRCPKYSLFSENMPLEFRSRKDLLKYVNQVEAPEFKNQYDNLTELDWLSCNKGQSEIHMMALAEAMRDAICSSEPKKLNQGDWHLPMIEIEEDE